MTGLPQFDGIALSRQGRRLTVMLDRPAVMNAVDGALHGGLVRAFEFAAADPASDVVVLTGAGRAFSAGGDLDGMERIAADPDLFAAEARNARRLVHALLDIDKPVVARLNGDAVGLGATLALLCDVILAADTARIGDPHVAVGLVAGDGGAAIWPQLVGFARAKEYLLTGALIPAPEAARIGLVNHAVPAADLDVRVDALCDRLLSLPTEAVRWTKMTVNLELKRLVQAVLEPGLAWESLSVRTDSHRRAVAAARARLGRKGAP